MPSLRATALLAVRAALVVAGGGVAAATVYGVATMPPPPPESDGFVAGAAYFYGTIVTVLALGVAGVGVALPTLLGASDPVGFGRGQRFLLRAAAAVVGVGFVVGVALGFATGLQYGFFHWLALVVLGVVLVCVAVVWRLLGALAAALWRGVRSVS